MSLKIAHISDVHLGSKLTYLGEKAKAHRARIANAFVKAVDEALNREVDLFLIAGDLFDSPFPSSNNVGIVIEQISRLVEKGIYVAIVPGNHDYLEHGSVYFRPEFTHFASENLKIFYSPKVEKWYIAQLDTTVHGAAIVQQKSKLSRLKDYHKNSESKFNVGIIHGSVDLMDKSPNHPIYKAEIQELGFDYLALGDWHSPLDVSSGPVTAWYSGCLERLGVDESDPGYMLIVEIDNKTKVEKIKVSSLEFVKKELDINKYENLEQLISDVGRYSGNLIMAYIILKGTKAVDSGINLTEITERLSDRFYHLKVSDQSTLALSEEQLSRYPENYLIGKYIRSLNKSKARSEEKKQIIDRAIQLGVKLLEGGDYDY